MKEREEEGGGRNLHEDSGLTAIKTFKTLARTAGPSFE